MVNVCTKLLVNAAEETATDHLGCNDGKRGKGFLKATAEATLDMKRWSLLKPAKKGKRSIS